MIKWIYLFIQSYHIILIRKKWLHDESVKNFTPLFNYNLQPSVYDKFINFYQIYYIVGVLPVNSTNNTVNRCIFQITMIQTLN